MGGHMKQARLTIFFTALIILFAIALGWTQSLIDGSECVSYDTINKRYLVSCWSTGQVVAVDTNGYEAVVWENPTGAVLSHHIVGNRFFVATDYNPGGVAVIDLDADTLITKFYIPGAIQLDGMTSDTSGNLYVVAPNNARIYKINLATYAYSIFSIALAPFTQDLLFDTVLNKIIAVGYSANAPIQYVNIPTGTVTNIVNNPHGYMDGIARDNEGNYYVSCYTGGKIYRYDPAFTNPPTEVSSGHTDPANIGFDPVNNLLLIPNFNAARVDLIGIHADFKADITHGNIPLTVNFTSRSINHPTVDSWSWDFGDGQTGSGQNPTHTYDAAGLYRVVLDIVTPEGNFQRRRHNYIFALADTIIAPALGAMPGAVVEIPVYARNTAPLKKIVLPFNYHGPAGLFYDSFSTAGCRTEFFDSKTQGYMDNDEGRVSLIFENGWLEPGSGPIAKLYFTVTGSDWGVQSDLTLESFLGYWPTFTWCTFNYSPYLADGHVRIPVCGDTNGDDKYDILDIIYLINYKFKGGPGPALTVTADVNSDGKIDILDIICLINNKFKNGPAPNCTA